MPELGCFAEDFLMRKVGNPAHLSVATSGAFDATMAPRALVVTASAGTTSYWEGSFWTAWGDGWFSVMIGAARGGTLTNANTADTMTVLRDSVTGTDVLRVKCTGRAVATRTTDLTCEYNDAGTWTALPGSVELFDFASPANVLRLAFRVKLDDTAGVLGWYSGGVLVGEITGDTLRTAATTVDTVRFFLGSSAGSFAGSTYLSEGYAHTDDLRYLRLGTFVPTAATGGDPVAWSGDHTAINEATLNESTVISTTTVDAVESWNAADKATVAAGLTVLGVGMATYGRCGATGPQNLQFGIHIGGAFQFTGNVPNVTTAYGIQHYEWAARPDTAADFSLADVDAIRWAVKATT